MQWKTGMRSIGEVFNIGTGRPTRIKDLAETIIRISNKELEPRFEQVQIGDIRESYAEISRQSQTVEAILRNPLLHLLRFQKFGVRL